MMRRIASWWAVMLIAGAAGCARRQSASQSSFCEPRALTFCRCANLEPGTRACNDAGDGFSECGPCTGGSAPGSKNGSGSKTGSNNTGTNGTGTDGAGKDGTGKGTGRQLLAACAADAECASKSCRSGFCTKTCTKPSECGPTGECVSLDAQSTVCMPRCATAQDCSPYKAPPSLCGYARAADNWHVRVCNHWGDNHLLLPLQGECTPLKHQECNLGYKGRALVCTESGVCAKGCFLDADCPTGASCSTDGTLGECR